jgi:hypothetical protein
VICASGLALQLAAGLAWSVLSRSLADTSAPIVMCVGSGVFLVGLGCIARAKGRSVCWSLLGFLGFFGLLLLLLLEDWSGHDNVTRVRVRFGSAIGATLIVISALLAVVMPSITLLQTFGDAADAADQGLGPNILRSGITSALLWLLPSTVLAGLGILLLIRSRHSGKSA